MNGEINNEIPFNPVDPLLKVKLRDIQRTKQFEDNWLKRNHPVIFGLLKEASHENDQMHMRNTLKKMSDMFRGK